MILITTPNGKVGSEVVRQLLQANQPVRAAVHTPAHAAPLEAQGAQTVHFDFHDPASIDTALQGARAVFLALPPAFDATEQAGRRVIDAAARAGAERLVLLTAMGVEHSDNPLRALEVHLQASGLQHTILRPNWFFQNFSTGMQGAIRHAGAIIEPAADARTAFIDVRDLAEIAVKALTENGHDGQAYTLTGGAAHDRAEVARAISRTLGRDIHYQPITPEAFEAMTREQQWPESVARQMAWLYGAVREGHTAHTTSTFRDLTGREPTDLDTYARDHQRAWA